MIESWHQGTWGVNLSNKILTEKSTGEIMYNMTMEYIQKQPQRKHLSFSFHTLSRLEEGELTLLLPSSIGQTLIHKRTHNSCQT